MKDNQTITAPNARVFKGVNVLKDPYIDGILTLNADGLSFIDHSQHVVFSYLPKDLQHVTLGITRLSIKPRNGQKFAVSLDPAATQQEVRDIRKSGLASISGGGVGLVVGGSALADASRLGNSNHRDVWAMYFKSLNHSAIQSRILATSGR